MSARASALVLNALLACHQREPPQIAPPPAETSILCFNVLADTHHISEVVAAIRQGKVTEVRAVDADGAPTEILLRLPDGLLWPAAEINVMFVRKFYAPLLEKVLCFCPSDPTAKEKQRNIVTGQPGTGKSVWM